MFRKILKSICDLFCEIDKLLFNDSLNLDEANFANLKDGTKEFKVVLKPKVNEDKNEDIEENYKKKWSRWND